MATLQELINHVEGEQYEESVKLASDQYEVDELEKFAHEISDLSEVELDKLAEEIEEMESEESYELMKEASASGRYIARGYWDRILELSSQQ